MMRFALLLSLSLCGSILKAEGKEDAIPVAQAKTTSSMPVVQKFALWEIEEAVVAETNFHRLQRGLPPLKVDPTLVSWSRNHSWYMARSGAFHHGSYPCCENIAMGQRDHVEVLRTWMNSSGHAANILRFRHGRIGVAAYQRNGMIYWTQQFAADAPPIEQAPVTAAPASTPATTVSLTQDQAPAQPAVEAAPVYRSSPCSSGRCGRGRRR